MKYLLFFVLLGAVLITAGCVSENKGTAITSTQTTPALQITSVQPKFVEGDILAKTISSSDLFLLILEYDSQLDKYERAFVNKKSDGSWFRSNDKSDFVDRILMEKLYPVKVGHVSSLSVTSTETKTSTPITTSAPTSSMTTTVPTTSATTTVTITPTQTTLSSALPAPSVMILLEDRMRAELFSIRGSNFQSGASVKLTQTGYPDVIVKSANVASGAEIRFNVNNIPCSNPPGQYNIVVTNPDGQSGMLANSFVVLGLGPSGLAVGDGNLFLSCLNTGSNPFILTVNPSQGAINDVLTLQINGQTFHEAVKVSFIKGATEIICTSPVSMASTKILCNLDLKSAVAGDWDVTVLNLDDQQKGTWNQKFKIIGSIEPPIVPPQDSQDITSITPTFTYGNDVQMTMIGTNFQQGCTAKMTKSTSTSVVIVAREVQWNSATQLTAWFTIPLPRQLGTYNVIVTNPDGNTHSLPNGFEVR